MTSRYTQGHNLLMKHCFIVVSELKPPTFQKCLGKFTFTSFVLCSKKFPVIQKFQCRGICICVCVCICVSFLLKTSDLPGTVCHSIHQFHTTELHFAHVTLSTIAGTRNLFYMHKYVGCTCMRESHFTHLAS